MSTDTFHVHEENAWRALDGGVVVINGTTTVYYSMNHAGAFVWHLLLESGVGVDAITRRLSAHYDEPSGDLLDHVRSFLSTLEEEGLIGRRAGLNGASDAPTQQPAFEKADNPYRAPRLDKFDSLERLIVSGE